jgi:hypothetical protein
VRRARLAGRTRPQPRVQSHTSRGRACSDFTRPRSSLPHTSRPARSSTFQKEEFLVKGRSAPTAEVAFTVGMPSSNWERVQSMLADRSDPKR